MTYKQDHKLPATLFTADGQQLRWTAYVFLALLCLAFFVPGFVNLPSVDRDEASFAQASKQMIETGNYIDIRLQDKPRYKKPIGIYWLQTTMVRLINPDYLSEIWAYRLPSLFGATLAVLLTASLGSLLFGPVTGFLAAMMMAACVLLNVEARLAKTDAALLASIMAAQLALARAYLAPATLKKSWRDWLNPLLFWTTVGVGILIKGPIIVLVVASTLLWLRLSNKNLSWLSELKPIVGLPYLLALTAPWFIAILTQSHGQFLQESAGHDLLGKIWQGQDRGMLPPGMHLLALPVVFFPFSLFVLLAAVDIWKIRHDFRIAFCLGWIIPVWVIFELSLTKLPHYVLPTYPAIAILAAKVFCDGYPHLLALRTRWPVVLLVTVWTVIGVGFAVAFAILPYALDHSWNQAQIIGGIILVITQAMTLILLAQRRPGSILMMVFGQLVFLGCVFGLTLPNIQHLWLTREAYDYADIHKVCPILSIVSVGYDEPSLIFMAGTKTELVTDAAQAAERLRQDHCKLALVATNDRSAFLAAFHQPNRMPQLLREFTGYNIGSGHTLTLLLYSPPLK